MWHDHSTILCTGYILFAVWVVYDLIVFLTDDEYTTKTGQLVSNLLEVIEEPVIYMIAPSSSSPDEQLALVPDRVECLQQFSHVAHTVRNRDSAVSYTHLTLPTIYSV